MENFILDIYLYGKTDHKGKVNSYFKIFIPEKNEIISEFQLKVNSYEIVLLAMKKALEWC